jgi:hypothetical protein
MIFDPDKKLGSSAPAQQRQTVFRDPLMAASRMAAKV